MKISHKMLYSLLAFEIFCKNICFSQDNFASSLRYTWLNTVDLRDRGMFFNRLHKDLVNSLGNFITGNKKVIQMNFVKINPDGVQFTQPFDYLQTNVTQWQFAKVMEINPSFLKLGKDSVKIQIGSNSIVMQPNHPVEWVSLGLTIKFFDILNNLSATDSDLVYELIPDHQRGDTYRLPTENEWLFVVSMRGKNFDWPNDAIMFDRHVWHKNNSYDTSHVVASKDSLLVDNDDGTFVQIYDVLGNIGTFLIDEKEDASGAYGLVGGGGWYMKPKNWLLDEFRFEVPSEIYTSVGIRIVREHKNTLILIE